MRDVFIAHFAECHFNKSVFLPLGGEKLVQEERQEMTWNAFTVSHFDPYKNQYKLEVQRIIHFQNLAN